MTRRRIAPVLVLFAVVAAGCSSSDPAAAPSGTTMAAEASSGPTATSVPASSTTAATTTTAADPLAYSAEQVEADRSALTAWVRKRNEFVRLNMTDQLGAHLAAASYGGKGTAAELAACTSSQFEWLIERAAIEPSPGWQMPDGSTGPITDGRTYVTRVKVAGTSVEGDGNFVVTFDGQVRYFPILPC